MKKFKSLFVLLMASLVVSGIMNIIDDIGYGMDNMMVIIITAIILTAFSFALALIPITLLNLIYGPHRARSVAVIWAIWLLLSGVNLINNYHSMNYII